MIIVPPTGNPRTPRGELPRVNVIALLLLFVIAGAGLAVGITRDNPFWLIGAHVRNVARVFVAGSFFQHVCGNSEPVSAE